MKLKVIQSENIVTNSRRQFGDKGGVKQQLILGESVLFHMSLWRRNASKRQSKHGWISTCFACCCIVVHKEKSLCIHCVWFYYLYTMAHVWYGPCRRKEIRGERLQDMLGFAQTGSNPAILLAFHNFWMGGGKNNNHSYYCFRLIICLSQKKVANWSKNTAGRLLQMAEASHTAADLQRTHSLAMLTVQCLREWLLLNIVWQCESSMKIFQMHILPAF